MSDWTEKLSGLSDQEIAELDDEEVREIAEEAARDSPNFVSNFLGRNVQGKVSEDTIQDISEQIEELIFGLRGIAAIEDEQERNEKAAQFIDEFFPSFLESKGYNVPEADTGFEGLAKLIQQKIKRSRKDLGETNYNCYLDEVVSLAEEIVEQNKYYEIEDYFLENVPELDDVSVMQHIFGPTARGELNIQDDAEMTRKHVEHLIGIYQDYIGIVEKLVPQFIAAAEVMRDRNPDYDKLRHKMTWNEYIDKLEKYGYSNMAQAVDRRIRNAITHRDKNYDVVEKEVTFLEAGEPFETMSYTRVKEETTELVAFFTALFLFDVLVMEKQMMDNTAKLREIVE